MYELIPHARRPAVARALTRAFGTADLDAAAPVTGGLSGAAVLKIRVGGVSYLLRVEGERDVFRDPGRWYGCMRQAAEAALAPRVYDACAEEGVAIMDFVPERSIALDYHGSREDLLVELAQAVRLLHETPAFPPLMDYLDGLELLTGELRASGLLPAPLAGEVLARFAEVLAVYRRLTPEPVSSHNDLNPRNVLYDGRRLWLVDWESAFLADRYVDLASVINFFARGPDEAEAAIRTYFRGEPGPARRARLFLARQINHLFYGTMFLNGAARERPGAVAGAALSAPPLAELHAAIGLGDFALDSWEGRVAYGSARLAEGLATLASPACAAALAAA